MLRLRTTLLIVAIVVWAGGVAAGLAGICVDSTPSGANAYPAIWPAGSALERSSGRPALGRSLQTPEAGAL
jgi:hypothetical protein